MCTGADNAGECALADNMGTRGCAGSGNGLAHTPCGAASVRGSEMQKLADCAAVLMFPGCWTPAGVHAELRAGRAGRHAAGAAAAGGRREGERHHCALPVRQAHLHSGVRFLFDNDILTPRCCAGHPPRRAAHHCALPVDKSTFTPGCACCRTEGIDFIPGCSSCSPRRAAPPCASCSISICLTPGRAAIAAAGAMKPRRQYQPCGNPSSRILQQ